MCKRNRTSSVGTTIEVIESQKNICGAIFVSYIVHQEDHPQHKGVYILYFGIYYRQIWG